MDMTKVRARRIGCLVLLLGLCAAAGRAQAAVQAERVRRISARQMTDVREAREKIDAKAIKPGDVRMAIRDPREADAKMAESVAAIKNDAKKAIEQVDTNFQQLAEIADELSEEKESLAESKTIITTGLVGSFAANLLALFGYLARLTQLRATKRLNELAILEKEHDLREKGVID